MLNFDRPDFRWGVMIIREKNGKMHVLRSRDQGKILRFGFDDEAYVKIKYGLWLVNDKDLRKKKDLRAANKQKRKNDKR